MLTSPPPAHDAVGQLSLSVIICCYTTDRYDQVQAALASALAQLEAGDEAIVVVDHNPELRAALTASVPSRTRVIDNAEAQGLSGARNTGVAAAGGAVTVFLDDDAVLLDGALASVRSRFADRSIVAIGGSVRADWHAAAPRWFPDEFGWVVGCDYRGLPGDGEEIRNPIGAAMATRREPLRAIGGFSPHLGRRGAFPAGCEETLMGIALRQADPTQKILRDTGFGVRHAVSADRATVRYFAHRCFQEGRSKARLATLASTGAALASERSYAIRILTAGLWRHRRTPRRALAIVCGFGFTTAGFVLGSASLRLDRGNREGNS